MKNSKGFPLGVWLAVLTSSVLFGNELRGQDQETPTPGLSEEDRRFVEDFSAAVEEFRDMTLEDFRADYGPNRAYRVSDGQFIRGDCNEDERLNIADPSFLLNWYFLSMQEPPCLKACDANDDGRVNIADASYILGFTFLQGSPPPAPFPEKGVDVSDDDLSCDNQGRIDYDPFQAQYLDLITTFHPLTPRQKRLFGKNGFVVYDDRKFFTFAQSLDEIHRQDLPIYISVDALLDALHLSMDEILLQIEEALLIELLDSALEKLDSGIEALRKYSGGADIEADLDNVAFWICTARSLLKGNGEEVPCQRGVDEKVSRFLDHVSNESVMPVDLFGAHENEAQGCVPLQREDFSQFRPRGHYTRSESLMNYFRAMMWVQRIGTKFAECKRHAAAAYLLTRNLYDSGAIEDLERIDGVVKAIVGSSDSLNPPGMLDLVARTDITAVADLYDDIDFANFVQVALETGAGKQLINSQVLRSNPVYPAGFTPIPPAFHVMGQRFIVDSFVFTNTVFDRVCEWRCPIPCAPSCGRLMPSPLDAMFVLGNPVTVPLLEADLEKYNLHPNLAALEWIVSSFPEEFWSDNLYNVWLSALRTLNQDTTGTPYPQVMQTRAWDRRILQTQLASWAQLRHDTILYAKPSYGFGLCEYPEGWVDPYPEFYTKLAEFAEQAIPRFEALGIFAIESMGHRGRESGEDVREYYENLQAHSLKLAEIAQAELDEVDLTEDQRFFMKSVLKGGRGCVDPPPLDGWYLDLIFQEVEELAPRFNPTVADVHTYVDPLNRLHVLHSGVGYCNLMLISVENACGIKSYVGPVMSYHEFIDDRRMSDEEWKEALLLDTGEQPEWLPENFSPDGPPRPEWISEFKG